MSTAPGGSRPIASVTVNRFRAWFLIKLTNNNPTDVAQQIYDEWIDPDGKNPPSDNLIVTRADVVEIHNDDVCDFDIIIPVDAINEAELLRFKEYLQTLGQVLEARVLYHFPNAPYLSNGYISKEEAILGIDTKEVLPESLGKTRKSPGDNPWG